VNRSWQASGLTAQSYDDNYLEGVRDEYV